MRDLPGIGTLRGAIAAAREGATKHVFLHSDPGSYPCGFAWMYFKCRKNSPLAKVLTDAGFTWDDYRKHYALSTHEWTNTQSMDYKEDILRAAAAAALEHGVVFHVRTQID